MLSLTWSLQCLARLKQQETQMSILFNRCIMNIIRLQFPLDMPQHGFHESLYKIWEMLVLLALYASHLLELHYFSIWLSSFYAESFSFSMKNDMIYSCHLVLKCGKSGLPCALSKPFKLAFENSNAAAPSLMMGSYPNKPIIN